MIYNYNRINNTSGNSGLMVDGQQSIMVSMIDIIGGAWFPGVGLTPGARNKAVMIYNYNRINSTSGNPGLIVDRIQSIVASIIHIYIFPWKNSKKKKKR